MQLTTMQIAARCNKSERQVQRWIHEGKLNVQHIEGRLYEVSEDDLQPFLPHEVVDSLNDRIAQLEDRVHTLEGLVSSLTTPHTPTRRLTAPRAPYEPRTVSASDTLPEGYVLLYDLLKEHGLMSQRQAIIRDMTSLGLLKKGDWKVRGHHANNALDAEGLAEFLRRYAHEVQ